MTTVPAAWSAFTHIWSVDFEFTQPDGDVPRPICCVARELRTGELRQQWLADDPPDLVRAPEQPALYGTNPTDLVIAYYASAEMGCHLALGWPLPSWLVDLYVEFRRHTNGRWLPCGRGLLGACQFFDVPVVDVAEKTAMRELAIRGGPFTVDERQALLAYCQQDVDAGAQLFDRMQSVIDLPRALLRGQYMMAAARIERTGVPVDVPTLHTLRQSWGELKAGLIAQVDRAYGVFDGSTFKHDRFEQYLEQQGIPWERTETGRLKMDDATFRERSQVFPVLHPLRELQVSLSQLRLTELTVGPDGRNRTLLSAFGAKTGRNAPSTSRFIFGPATWLRHLIQPAPGCALAYIDWSQQEFGIAAALSGDAAMWTAYESGDPYLAFGQQAGAVPADATKQTHGAIRESFKSCVLAVQYGMGGDALARRLGQSPAHAAHLLELHRRTYPVFWHWSDSAVASAMLTNRLHSVFGWTLQLSDPLNVRSLQNYPMQANGAEMLRLACCLATEAGVRVCAPVHDAVLIEAPTAQLVDAVTVTQQAMAAASRIVLAGATLRSSATCIASTDRFSDPRGAKMWRTVLTVLAQRQGAIACAS